MLALAGLGAIWLIVRQHRQAEQIDAGEPVAETVPEQEAELHGSLRVVIDTFRSRPTMEQFAIFQLVYAICGFGPAGHLVKRGGQGLNADTWAWLYQTITPQVNLPLQADDRSFEELTGCSVTEALDNDFVVLCLVHFGDYIAKVNTQLVGHPMRQQIPGINETTTAYDTFNWLWGLTTDYEVVPPASRDFFDKFYPTAKEISLPAVPAFDTQYPETTGQLFMPPKERLGLYLCSDLGEVARSGLVRFSLAICGFGPTGTFVMPVAKAVHHHNSNAWSEFNTCIRCVANVVDKVSDEKVLALAANSWFLGEAGAYATYLYRVYYALTEEERVRCFNAEAELFDHEAMIAKVVAISTELLPQHLAAH